jgi:Tfp pilus assembly protein PilO
MKDVRKLLTLYKNSIISIGMILCCALVLFIGIIPSAKITYSLYQENIALYEEVQALLGKTERLAGMNEQELRSKLSILTSAVPSDKQIPSLFDSLEEIVRRSRVSLDDLALSNSQAISSESGKKQEKTDKVIGASLIGFSMTVTGSYKDLRSFLHEIISVRRFFRVRFFDVTFQDESTGQLRITADAFYDPLPQVIPSVASKLDTLSGSDEELIKKISVYPWIAEEVSSPLAPTVYEPKVNPFLQ